MEKLFIPEADRPYIEALRGLIRTGVTAAPNLEASPLISMAAVMQEGGKGASPVKRAHVFIHVLRRVINQRFEGKEAQTATILFGLDEYAGVPLQDRYRAVAKLYNQYWTWENYRKEPLTRHLLAVYLALRREAEAGSTVLPASAAKKVLVVKNISHEGPGLLVQLLHEVAVPYDVIDLQLGEQLPDPTNYSALIVLGGPDSANDPTKKITNEVAFVKQALAAGVPYLGVCLGLRIAVKALGGKVVKSPVKEVGLHNAQGQPYSVSLTNLALTSLGKKDPLFVGLRNHFRVFQLHGETVELTKSMQLLATGADCHNQIVKLGGAAYGIQSHFELTKEMLAEWLTADPDLTPLSSRKVLAEFEAIEEVYTITGLSLLRNFLHVAGALG
ncbi:MAG TPA: type 1 glutamine amidotransferase [Candidatus Saccharimonadales bacterium]|nr:type 1 glutamine amidotransferase [Candidatus Saccharimonadales bacterium]